jgi:tRNA (cmo5U34)-methyltransferase
VSVASHLAVTPAAYDARIRELIPYYDDVIAETARSLRFADRPVRLIVDLGIGTGALTRACLAVVPRARVLGIDADAAMTDVARVRLRRWRRQISLVQGDLMSAELPNSGCDAIVATFALHHIRTRRAKLECYRRCRRALRRGGVLINGDCAPATLQRAAAADLDRWLEHLSRTAGSRAAARRIYESWADEDTYMPLSTEVRLLEKAGFVVDVPWRRSPFAVIVAMAGNGSSSPTRAPRRQQSSRAPR